MPQLKPSPQFEIGQMVLFESEFGTFDPVIIKGIDPNGYMDSFGYHVGSVLYPSACSMIVHPRWVRPMIRPQSELRKLLKVVK